MGIVLVKIFKFFSFFFLQKSKKIISSKKSTFHHFYALHDLPIPTQILFIFCFFPKIAKKNFGWKIMSLWAWNGSHASDRMSACLYYSLWRRKKMTFSHFIGKFKNGPFCPNLGHFYLKFQLYIGCGFQFNWKPQAIYNWNFK